MPIHYLNQCWNIANWTLRNQLLGTNFSKTLIKIHTSSFKKLHLKMLYAKRQPFCLGLNVLRLQLHLPGCNKLTHRGRVTHICVGNLTIIVSDNGLSPGRRQAIIWANARILLIEPLGTILSEILIAIQTFSFKKMHLKMASAKWRPFCLGLNVLTSDWYPYWTLLATMSQCWNGPAFQPIIYNIMWA